MRKKFLTLVLVLIFLFSSNIYANENILSFDNVLSGIKNSPTMQSLDYQLKSTNNYYEKMKNIADIIPAKAMRQAQSDLSQVVSGGPITVFIFGMPVTYDHTLSNGEITQILANFGFPYTKKDKLTQDLSVYAVPKTLLSNYRVLEKTKELTLQNLKLNSEEIFNGLLLQNKVIKLNEEIVSSDNLQFKNMQNKYAQGVISKKELESFKLKVEQDQYKLNIQKRIKQNMIFSLNKLIGANITTEYDSIKGEIIETDQFSIDIEEAINNAIENRFEIYKLKEDIQNKERELLFTNIYYDINDPEFLSAKYKLSMAKKELEDTKDDIRYELEDAYQSIELNYNKINKAKIALENATKKYEDLKQKFDRGLVTKDILAMTHIGVTSAELNLLSSINTYNMSVKKFKAATGIGPGFVEGVQR